MAKGLIKFDRALLGYSKKVAVPVARISLFIIFFWFGILKIVAESPANPLVESLLERTLPFITFNQFIGWFGGYEMLIGIVFLVPRWTRLAVVLLIPHMITTFLPLVALPAVTWNGFMVPTLEGQYIIKNLIIIALALSVAVHLHPIKER
jgi:uncharacterized membrane protein YkgB